MGFYWNTNSTTRIRPEVTEVLKKYTESNDFDIFHNPSDISNKSKDLFSSVIATTKVKFEKFINADRGDFVVFTSCGSESNNLALATGEKFVGKNGTIIISAMEHDSINLRCEFLKELGYQIEVIGVDEKGRYDYDRLYKIKARGKIFISMMLVNNELGNIYDLKRVSEIAHKRWKDVLIHTDAVQALGKMPIDVKDLGVDMLSVSGHKIGAPKGIGALYVKKGVEIQPLIYGHQECGYRGGTENIPYIAAFGKALEVLQCQMNEEYGKVLRDYRDRLQDGILNICKELGFTAYVNGDIENRVNNTISITIEDVDNLRLISMAEAKNLYFSTGSACNSAPCAAKFDSKDLTKPSAVMQAILHPNYKNVIRISIGDEFYSYGECNLNYDRNNDKEILIHIKAQIKNFSLNYGLKDFRSVLEKYKKQYKEN